MEGVIVVVDDVPYGEGELFALPDDVTAVEFVGILDERIALVVLVGDTAIAFSAPAEGATMELPEVVRGQVQMLVLTDVGDLEQAVDGCARFTREVQLCIIAAE